MKTNGPEKLVNSTKDVRDTLSCYSCSSLVGDDCWMANASRDVDTMPIQDQSMLMTSEAIESLFGKAALPFTQPSSTDHLDVRSIAVTKCNEDEKYCMVTRVEYAKAEVPSPQRFFWALERRCASSCLDGCIAIGDGMLPLCLLHGSMHLLLFQVKGHACICACLVAPIPCAMSAMELPTGRVARFT